MSDERRQRVVEYLLGEMDEAEVIRFEDDRRTDPDLERMVLEMEPVTSRLESLPAESWENAEPPPLVMPGSASAEAPPATALPESPPLGTPVAPRPARPRFRFGLPAMAGVLASALILLGAGIAIGTQIDGSESSGPAVAERTVALESFGDGPPQAAGEVALVSSTGDSVNLDVSGLAPTGEDEFYELWLLGKEGQLVALGTFRVEPNGDSNIEVPLPVNPDEYEYFDVSIQPDNGDPNHSGRSVLRGVTKT